MSSRGPRGAARSSKVWRASAEATPDVAAAKRCRGAWKSFVRLRNQLVPGKEGPWTRHLPDGEVLSIYDAALRYRDEGVPLIVIAAGEYGSGSSRDWAAKGPALLGSRAVIAESFERIHRSNLVGMGILPLEFPPGTSATSLGLTGAEVFSVRAIEDALTPRKRLTVDARTAPGRRSSDGAPGVDRRRRVTRPNKRSLGDLLFVRRRSRAAVRAVPVDVRVALARRVRHLVDL